MPRKARMAVPEGNGPIPQNQYVMPGIALEDSCQIMSEAMDKIFDKHIGQVLGQYEEQFKSNMRLDKLVEEMRVIDQRVASLEQDARYPYLAMGADMQADMKTRKRTEGTAIAV